MWQNKRGLFSESHIAIPGYNLHIVRVLPTGDAQRTRLGEELGFETRQPGTAAKFIIKSSLLFRCLIYNVNLITEAE